MSNVYVISDLHLGHKNILKFAGKYRGGATTVDEHDWALISRIRSVCRSKRDLLYILGDVAMQVEKLELLNEIPARKILVRGNHDTFQDGVYRKYFDSIQGLVHKRYNSEGYWFSHAPIHPFELRGRRNVHGHVHANSILEDRLVPFSVRERWESVPDSDYINVCVENCDGYPVNTAELETFKGVIS